MNAEKKETTTEETIAGAPAGGDALLRVETEAVESVLRAQGWDVEYVDEQNSLNVELEGKQLCYVVNPSYMSVLCTVPVLFDAGFEIVLRELVNKINTEFLYSNAYVCPAPNNAEQYVIQHSCTVAIGAGLTQEQLEYYVTKTAVFSCYVLEVIDKFLEQGKEATGTKQ